MICFELVVLKDSWNASGHLLIHIYIHDTVIVSTQHDNWHRIDRFDIVHGRRCLTVDFLVLFRVNVIEFLELVIIDQLPIVNYLPYTGTVRKMSNESLGGIFII